MAYDKTKSRTQYGEQLRDPRWQKKRLEILNRDAFKCRMCGDETATLNVHHWFYMGAPWDTPDFGLITLCEDCHQGASHIAVKGGPEEGPSMYLWDLLVLGDTLREKGVSDILEFAVALSYLTPDQIQRVGVRMVKEPK